MEYTRKDIVYAGDIFSIYKRFNELVFLDEPAEFEGDQMYGTDCYGVEPYKVPVDYDGETSIPRDTKERWELFFRSIEDGEEYFDDADIISYLQFMEELPKEDILFRIDY